MLRKMEGASASNDMTSSINVQTQDDELALLSSFDEDFSALLGGRKYFAILSNLLLFLILLGSEDLFDKNYVLAQKDIIPLKFDDKTKDFRDFNFYGISDLNLSDDFRRPYNFEENDFEDDDDDDQSVDDMNRKRKRARQSNPDADIIAEATERNLKMLNLDPFSKEGKRQRRKIRNRMSAQLHRERKKAYIDTLEGMVRERNARIIQLHSNLKAAMLENQYLRGQLGMLYPGVSEVENTTASSIFDTAENMTKHAAQQCEDVAITGRTYENSSCSCTQSSDEEDDEEGFTSESTAPSSPSSRSSSSAARHNSLHTSSGFQLFSLVILFGYFSLFSRSPSPTTNLLGDKRMDFDGNNIDTTFGSPFLQLEPPISTSFQGKEGYGVGRVLMTSPSTMINRAAEDEEYLVSLLRVTPKLPYPLPLPAPTRSVSSALWTYQDHVLQLFPSLNATLAKGNEKGKKASTDTRSKTRNSNLRTRIDPVRVRDAGNAFEDSEEEYRSMTSLVVAQPPANSWRKSSLSASLDDSTTSHILMTNGHALLDSSLIPYPISSSPEQDSTRTKYETNSGPLHFSTTGVNPTAVSPWSWLPSPTGNHADLSNREETVRPVVRSSSNDYSSTSVPAPIMVMLLPASSVRWGKTWMEGSPLPVEMLMKNWEGRATAETEAEHGINNSTTLWVEIRCSVFSAEIVRNVTLPSFSTSS